MISKENLNGVYERVIHGEELTTKALTELGYNSKTIKELVDTGVLNRVRRGYYELTSADGLLSYGKSLITQKRHGDATLCFEKGYEIDPTNRSICFQLFLRSIKNGNYARTFELYEKLTNSGNKFYDQDLNFYLYLLSLITEVPEKYQSFAKFMTFKDISVSKEDKRYSDSQTQNRIRTAVLQKKLSLALKRLNDSLAVDGKSTVQDLIAKTLIVQAINVENERKNVVANLIKDKKYAEAVDFLLAKDDRSSLTIIDNYTLKLLNIIMEIKRTKKMPRVVALTGDTVFDAIDTNNFTVALRLNEEHNNKNNIIGDNNQLTMLLNDVCTLIKELAIEKNEAKETPAPKVEEPAPKEEPKKLITFESIIAELFRNNTKTAIEDLKEYLKAMGKEEYAFLIIDLIQLDILEKDTSFSEAMIALTLLSKNEFVFDGSSYLQEFYMKLFNRDIAKAKIYLDILTRASKIGIVNFDVSPLITALAHEEEILKGNEEVLKRIDEEPKEETPVEPKKEPLRETSISAEPSKANILHDSDREFIARKHEELLDKKGAIILKPMDEDRVERLLEIINDYFDMTATTVKNGNSSQIILRYFEPQEEFINYKDILKEAYGAYDEGRYNDSISSLLYLLKVMPNPKSKIYGRIGLAYMKKFQIDLAIEYLNMATKLAQKEGSNLDFTGLIERLQGKETENERKPQVKISESELSYEDINNFFGIDNFYVINDSIMQSGLPVESACEELGLSLEETDLIKLIYAREFFIRGDFDNGDAFMRSVEKSPNKTELVKSVIREIETNRIFYQNRDITMERPEIHIVKPR